MNALGVPTTRALCAVTTGEEVHRQLGPEPGGIFTRVAQSHLRVGTFQYFAFREDIEAIEILLNYTIERHYPELLTLPSNRKRALHLLQSLATKQSDLIAQWSSLGFIHGVMNTDNFSMAGITIDYGPCAFMEEFHFDKVFSSIDTGGRYAYFNQVPIAKWNLLRLADCLLPLIDGNSERAIALVEEALLPTFEAFEEKRSTAIAKKLGLGGNEREDHSLATLFLKYLEKHALDFTQSFRSLPSLFHGEYNHFVMCSDLREFVDRWQDRGPKIETLNSINPIFIPRNHQVEAAIQLAYNRDKTHFLKLLEAVTNPFDESEELWELSLPAKAGERIEETFCGT
jgi:uncharacterized protein YdiU (UPF0061 family)